MRVVKVDSMFVRNRSPSPRKLMRSDAIPSAASSWASRFCQVAGTVHVIGEPVQKQHRALLRPNFCPAPARRLKPGAISTGVSAPMPATAANRITQTMPRRFQSFMKRDHGRFVTESASPSKSFPAARRRKIIPAFDCCALPALPNGRTWSRALFRALRAAPSPRKILPLRFCRKPGRPVSP